MNTTNTTPRMGWYDFTTAVHRWTGSAWLCGFAPEPDQFQPTWTVFAPVGDGKTCPECVARLMIGIEPGGLAILRETSYNEDELVRIVDIDSGPPYMISYVSLDGERQGNLHVGSVRPYEGSCTHCRGTGHEPEKPIEADESGIFCTSCGKKYWSPMSRAHTCTGRPTR